MNGMILAAGFGARLLPHTERMPKPLFPILDKTLLEIAIDKVKMANPNHIVINVCYLGEQIIDFLESRDFGVEIKISHEPSLLGTGGGIKYARRWLDSDDFVVLNSDILVDVEWDTLIKAHKDKEATATLALRSNNMEYGALSIDSNNKITRFLDAIGPGHDSASDKLMFTGVSILSPEIFNFMPPSDMVNISDQVYAPMVNNGEKLYGVKVDWSWTDAGTTENYHRAVMGKLKEYNRATPYDTPHGVSIKEPVYIDQEAIIETGASIGPNVSIHRGATVGAYAILKDCVVLPGSVVAERKTVSGTIV